MLSPLNNMIALSTKKSNTFSTLKLVRRRHQYGGEYYSLSQLKDVLVQFYTGLFNHLRGCNALPNPLPANHLLVKL